MLCGHGAQRELRLHKIQLFFYADLKHLKWHLNNIQNIRHAKKEVSITNFKVDNTEI
jgi:hypothetical protein